MDASSGTQQLLRSFERHGADLHAVASVLTADPDLAERLVVQAMTAAHDGADLRRLGALVVRGWLDSRSGQLPNVTPPEPSLLDQLHDLPSEQRAALALCRFGGHTCQTAAAALGLGPQVVAQHLTAALRSIAGGPATPGGLSGE